MDLLQKLSDIVERPVARESDLEAFANSIPHMVWVADSKGNVLINNQRFQDYTGLSNKEMLATDMSLYMHPEDYQISKAAWEEAVEKKETYKIQYRLRRRDGQYRWNSGMALPFRNTQGDVEHWFGTWTDIHDQKIVEEKLRHSEERYSIAVNTAEIGTWEWETDSLEIEATDTFLKLFGLPNSLHSQSVESIFKAIHPDDREKVRVAMRRALESRQTDAVKFRVIHLGGVIRWLVGQGRPIYDPSGRVIRFVGVNFDVTDHEHSQQKLKDSESQFRQLAEAIPHIVWQADIQGNYTFVSKQWFEKTGESADSALDNGWLRFVHPDDQLQTTRKWQEAVIKGEAMEHEFRLRAHNEYRWYLLRCEPVHERTGQILHWFGTLTDIHQQKELREEQRILSDASQILSASFDYKKSLRNLMHFVVKEFGECGYITLFESDRSVRFCEVYALSLKKEMILQQLVPLHCKDDAGTVSSAISSKEVSIRHHIDADYYKSIAMNEEQYALLEKLGSRSVMAAPLISRGKLIGIWCVSSGDPAHRFESFAERVFRTLSERVAIAMDNAMLFEDARKANDLKSAFLANISHEIRSPLAAILGFSDLLRDEDLLTSEKSHYLDVINRNGQQLQAIINDILDLSKVEAGHLEIDYLPLDIRELINDVIYPLQIKAQAKKLKIESFIKSDMPKLISLDPVRVKQIVSNLVSNAMKFTESGGVKIFVEATLIKPDKAHVRIRIIDTGIGIAADKRQFLFQPFSQADRSTTRQFGGAGLGLALSRRLAHAMNGDVWLEASEPNQGCKFCIQFNDVDVLQPAYSQSLPSDLDANGEGPLDCLRGVRILIVDDSQDNQKLIRHLLHKKEAVSDMAGNGLEAIEKAMANEYDLILCDLQMPLMDGYTAARNLRNRGYKKPIVALTAHAMAEVRQKCLDAGFTDHLAKPLRAKDLYSTVLRCLAEDSSGLALNPLI